MKSRTAWKDLEAWLCRVWPFIKLGAIINTPLLVDGTTNGGGADISSAVHCFVKFNRAAAILDPEAHVHTINSHVMRILNSIDYIDLGDGLLLAIHPRQSQAIQDGDEADAYHGFVLFDAQAL